MSTKNINALGGASVENLGTSETTIDGGHTGVNPISGNTFIDAWHTKCWSARFEILTHGKAATGGAIVLSGAIKGLLDHMLGFPSKAGDHVLPVNFFQLSG